MRKLQDEHLSQFQADAMVMYDVKVQSEALLVRDQSQSEVADHMFGVTWCAIDDCGRVQRASAVKCTFRLETARFAGRSPKVGCLHAR